MQVLQFQSGAWRKSGGMSPEAARELAWGPTLVWIRLEGIAQSRLEALGAVFDLHPLALEDVQNQRQRPKVEDYPNLTFVVVRIPRLSEEDMSWITVGVFLGPDFLITVCSDPVPEFDLVERRLLGTRASPKTGSIDHVFYQVVDTVVDAYFPLMDELEDRIEDLEDQVIDVAEQHELEKVQNMKHIVSQNRKTIFPMREAMVALEKGDHPNIRDETRLYLRDVADHMTRLAERLEHVKELTHLCQETWNATVANQTNVAVKRLTVVTIVFMFTGLLASIGGMNFPGFPPWDFRVVTLGILSITIVGLLLAWRKDWI